jgi:hypothetical protein
VQLVISDALKRRLENFEPRRFEIFKLAAVDVVKGRAAGSLAHTSALSGRQIYVLERQGYHLYYSRDPRRPGPVVFEEFLSPGEEDLVLDLFAEGPD